MHPNYKRNGGSQCADLLRAWTDVDYCGGPSLGIQNGHGDTIIVIVDCSAYRHGMPRHQCAHGIDLQTPHLSCLKACTKESDMCASKRASKPIMRKEANWQDPLKGFTIDQPLSSKKGSSESMPVGTQKMVNYD